MLDPLKNGPSQELPTFVRPLTYADAKLVWLLSFSGDANHVIAAKLGTMPSRVADILAENIHVGAREQAVKMVGPPKR